MWLPSYFSWALIFVGTSVGGIHPQASRLRGLATTNLEDQQFWRQPHGAGLTLVGLMLSLELSRVEVFGWWCSDVVWSCPLVPWLRCLLGGTGQGQPPPVSCMGTSSTSHRLIRRWLLHVLNLEGPGRGQAVNHSQVSVVPGLGPFSKRYAGHTKSRCYLFERF